MADGKPGVLRIGDGAANVSCRPGELGKFWMQLGYVTETEFCGYNGWALVDADNGATFFEQVPRGQRPSELLEVFETQPELPAERVRARKKG